MVLECPDDKKCAMTDSINKINTAIRFMANNNWELRDLRLLLSLEGGMQSTQEIRVRNLLIRVKMNTDIARLVLLLLFKPQFSNGLLPLYCGCCVEIVWTLKYLWTHNFGFCP